MSSRARGESSAAYFATAAAPLLLESPHYLCQRYAAPLPVLALGVLDRLPQSVMTAQHKVLDVFLAQAVEHASEGSGEP